MPHEQRNAFASRHPVHVTVKVRPDVPSLRHGKLVREVERSFRKACDQRRFRVVHYSLQSSHVHLIVEAAGAEDLGRGMKSTGARLARAVNRVFSRKGPVLADRLHHRVLKTPREVRHALAYVLLNARRHAGQRASRAEKLDPASSGPWFDAWRRHGLIALAEIPARG